MLRSGTCLVLLILGAALPSLAVEIKIAHDENADFSAIETYAWREGTPAAMPEVQEWIVTAVDRELQGKGLRRVDGEADVYVSTVAYGQMDVFVRGNYVHLDTAMIGVTTAHASDKTTGNLMVDFVVPGSDKPIWRGVAKEGFQSDKIDKAQGKINKIVKKLFKNFPPE